MDFMDDIELLSKGLCRGYEPTAVPYYEHIFFPAGEREARQYQQQVEDYCGICDLRDACLEYALSKPEEHGTWGGVDEWTRRSMRRRARKKNVA